MSPYYKNKIKILTHIFQDPTPEGMSLTVVCIIILFSNDGEILMSYLNPDYVEYNTGVKSIGNILQVPGGKYNNEIDETLEASAKRELLEETGISNATLVPFGYINNGQNKYCYWIGKYTCNSNELLIEIDPISQLKKSSAWDYKDPFVISKDSLTEGLALKWDKVLHFIQSYRSGYFLLDDQKFGSE